MKLIDIFEAPIADLKVQDKFDGPHYSKADPKLLKNPAHVEKIKAAFKHVPVDVNFYFWSTDDEDSEYHVQLGTVDVAWLRKNLGMGPAKFALRKSSPQNITMIITNNLSDQGQISLTPWMVMHRFVHGLAGEELNHGGLQGYFQGVKNQILELMEVGYGVDDHSAGPAMWMTWIEEVVKAFGHRVATMKSARQGKLSNEFELFYELATQFLVTGKVALNPLPDEIGEWKKTTDPRKWKQAQKIWAKLPGYVEKTITAAVQNAKGGIYVM